MSERLCLLSVHAHPDDESSKGAATIARYRSEGVYTVLVSCTGGEEGDILNPAMDLPEVRADIASVRRRELDEAVKIIGFSEVVRLGYRDSGMAGTPANSNPDSFAMAPFDEEVGRLVEVIRRVRSQVIITYPDERRYRHPDHVRVHEISLAAFDAAGDKEAYPDLGEPYEPLKLYFSAFPRARFFKRHEKFLELGLESPYQERIEKGDFGTPPEDEEEPTTKIALDGFEGVRRSALLAHASQIDPNSLHWFGLPDEVEHELHPYDSFELARSRVPVEAPEDDLFNGIRSE